uniref:Uncharacterized protein n=1 Tax=Globisporangium ultimum (strain ATCC 200006 / CBS 805.95 / DAOM BR144) TaxID=431595 RepID=K3WHQ7_GLOUD
MSLGLFDVDDRFPNRTCGSSTKTWISFGPGLKAVGRSPQSKQASPHLVTLCAVRGGGSVFPVEIALDTYEAIYYKQRYNRHNRFASSGLTLHLAKKANGQWLKDDYDVDATLRGRRDSQYAEMHAC